VIERGREWRDESMTVITRGGQLVGSLEAGRGASCLAHETAMKAIVQSRYGSPDVLQLGDVDEPAVGDDQVLVRVQEPQSTSVTGIS
jgi:hypothetical protein